MIHRPPTDNQAFSLVELAIVLVILGLLAGGVLSGQSLIRAAELRAFTSAHERYQTAALTFRDKYFSIPGDMTNATQFWGDNSSACSDSAIPNGTPGTCNGNGNGKIDETTPFASGATSETTQFWNQLALAGLIEGSYTGVFAATAPYIARGNNVPAGKTRSDTFWYNLSGVIAAGDADYYAMDYGNTLREQGSGASSASQLKAEEAWNIDTKIDDGKPAYGNVIARGWNNTCASPNSGAAANTNLDASYNLSNSAIQCMLIFRNQY